MEWGRLTSPRRGALKRGAMLLAGALGLGVAARAAPTEAANAPPSGGTTLELRGRAWHIDVKDRRRGVPSRGDRMAMYGELIGGPDGEKVGEFYAACYCVDCPFGMSPLAASNIEMHTFNLTDGSIIGM